MNKNYKGLIFGIIGATALIFTVVIFINNDFDRQNRHNMDIKYHIVTEKFASFKRGQEALIRMISRHPDVEKFLFTSTQDNAAVESFLYYTAQANENIMQIRLLSLDGMERIRIERTKDKRLHKVRDKNLQNKSTRDYFSQFKGLTENQIGYSQIDLNMEHGTVEVPWKPTLRIGLPVFKDTHKIGLVIINFYMQTFLEDIVSLGMEQLTLIDPFGYYILNKNPEKNWSRYQTPPFKDTFYNEQLKAQVHDFGVHKDESSIYPITFFNGEIGLVIFSQVASLSQQFSTKALQFTLVQFLAIMMIFIPSILIIRRTLNTLKIEKSKLAEQNGFLDGILENSFDAKVIIDEDAIIIRVNKATRILFSYTNDEMVGKNVKLLVPEPDRSLHDGYVKNHSGMQSKVIGQERKLEALNKNGSLIPISLAVTPVKLENGLFFIGTIRDLSPIVELKAQQREQESMMHQAKLASMGEMISAISHQWRQPLNSIGLISQELFYLYEDNELDESTMKKSKDDIMAQLHYMSQTIDDFRHFFSKEKELSTFNTIKLARELERLYGAQLKAHSLNIHIHCPKQKEDGENCPNEDHKDYKFYEMTAYPSELQHILLNLLSNAKDAILKLNQSNKDQHQITITIIPDEQDMIFEISDLAGGIDKETQSRLFEPYFTTKEMGTGLGLYIAKTITEQFLQGSLEYFDNSQEEYMGSNFRLKMPKHIVKNKE